MSPAPEKLISRSSTEVAPMVEPELFTALLAGLAEENCVYVHCHCASPGEDMLIRIWKTCFLVDRETHKRTPMIHAENISLAPLWTLLRGGKTHQFLLIFRALPSSCKTFDLVEEIAQSGGFEIRNIPRNEKDIYHVWII